MRNALVGKLAFTTFLSLAALSADVALAQSTAFTYQGRLEEAGAPANGPHDFRFGLFDAADNGTQVGETLCVDDIAVDRGLFTVQLDFGQQFATTAERHLDVQVRPDIGQPCTDNFGYVLLSPRQQLTATPRASHANSAFALDAADGSPSNAVFVDNDGQVGIGITSPGAPVHVQGAQSGAAPGEGVRIPGTDVSVANQSYLAFTNLTGDRVGYVGDGGATEHNIQVSSDFGDVLLYTAGLPVLAATQSGNVGVGTMLPRTAMHINGQSLWLTGGNGGGLPVSAGGGLRLYDDGTRANIFAFNYANGTPRTLTLQEPGGNVGIGTTSPLARLDVRGDIRLGSSGQFRAASGEENLRILRGTVGGSGAIIRGTGFTVTRVNQGDYLITFNTPFASAPSVTATVDDEVESLVLIDSYVAGIFSPSASSVRVRTRFHSSAAPSSATDQRFHFTAIGPR